MRIELRGLLLTAAAVATACGGENPQSQQHAAGGAVSGIANPEHPADPNAPKTFAEIQALSKIYPKYFFDKLKQPAISAAPNYRLRLISTELVPNHDNWLRVEWESDFIDAGQRKKVEVQLLQPAFVKTEEVGNAAGLEGISWKGKINVPYLWRENFGIGKGTSTSYDEKGWSSPRDGNDIFNCTVAQVAKTQENPIGYVAGCIPAENPNSASGYNWPTVGGLNQILERR